MTVRANSRFEQFLGNIQLREELARNQLGHVGGNLGAVILTDLQAAHTSLQAAVTTGDALWAADAAFAVAAVVHRANMAVLTPALAKPAQRRRVSRRNAIETNAKRREQNERNKALVRKLSAAGKTVVQITESTGIPRSTVYKFYGANVRDGTAVSVPCASR